MAWSSVWFENWGGRWILGGFWGGPVVGGHCDANGKAHGAKVFRMNYSPAANLESRLPAQLKLNTDHRTTGHNASPVLAILDYKR